MPNLMTVNPSANRLTIAGDAKMRAKVASHSSARLREMFQILNGKGAHKNDEERIVWDYIFTELERRGIITWDDDLDDFLMDGERL